MNIILMMLKNFVINVQVPVKLVSINKNNNNVKLVYINIIFI